MKGELFIDEDFHQLGEQLKAVSFSAAFILSDSNTAIHCVPLVRPSFETDHVIIIEAGEKNKTLDQSEAIWTYLIEHGADRNSILINVGGGMISDLGGFTAACFQRGIRFVHVPTSLLAMTDAAIGGKVGVDFQYHKNYIGLFSFPEFIYINPVFLKTLPRAEIKSGLAEMIKHAIIGSPTLFEALANIEDTLKMDWKNVLPASIEVKRKIVMADPMEKGIRKTLNFGHTLGHALESYFLEKKQPISHGLAVTYGMMGESKLAMDSGLLSSQDFEKILELLIRLLDPPALPLPGFPDLQIWLSKDKKNTHNRLSFSLPEKIGACRWDVMDLDPAAAIDWLNKQVSDNSIRFMSDPF